MAKYGMVVTRLGLWLSRDGCGQVREVVAMDVAWLVAN